MIDITKYCKKFYKKPAQFLDNQYIKSLLTPENHKVTRGVRGGTKIDKSLLTEFLLWLSPQTKQMIVEGKSLSEIKVFLDGFVRGTIPEEEIKRHYTYTGHNSR